MVKTIDQIAEEGAETISIDTQNGATLVGRFFDSRSNNGIVMLPGITEHRNSLYDFADRLNKYDFKVWAFDLNSQGDSTGNWDINQMQGSVHYLQSELKKRYGLKRIGALGNSAGAMAVGIAASKKDSELECLCLIAPPSSAQDYIPEWILRIGKSIPQPLVRFGAIALDILEADILREKEYIRLSRSQFRTKQGYRPHAQFGAMKIENLKDVVSWAINAPKLSGHVQGIHQPVLFVYGGRDSENRIRSKIQTPEESLSMSKEELIKKLPPNLRKMYEQVESTKKRLIIVPGACHNLNKRLRPFSDASLNSDPEYQWVKPEIEKHFLQYMT